MQATDPMDFNFIVRADSDAHLQRLCAKDIDHDWYLFMNGELSWSLQTYLLLRRAGCPVTCSRDLVPECINLGHASSLDLLQPRSDAFVVSLQADFPRVAWANMHIVQNQLQARGETAHWIPHWPQPGLIGRDSSRDSVSCVAHAGLVWMLAGTPEEWNRDLAPFGCEFRNLSAERWDNLSAVDILLAIRSFDHRTYRTKPPTKLLNAWQAGIPLVAGNDSAFTQIGTPGVDYLQVTSRKEAIIAIRRLKEDRALYKSIVEHGRRRAADYSRDRLINLWMELLTTQVSEQYRRWLAGDRESKFAWQYRVLRTQIVRNVRRGTRRFVQRVFGTEIVNRVRLRFR